MDSNVIIHRLARTFIWMPAILLAISLVSFSLFQVPKIQTESINKLLSNISKQTNFEVTVGYTNLTWYDKIVLNDLLIREKETKDTLISAKSMKIDIELFDLVLKKQLSAEVLELEDPGIHIKKRSDSLSINISQFIREVLLVIGSSNNNNPNDKAFIERIEIINGKFSFNDMRKDSILDKKDFYHLRYDKILTTISDFKLTKSSVSFEIDRFKGIDPSGQLNIKSFFGYCFYSPQKLAIERFLLNTDHSQIGDSIVLHYSDPLSLSRFMDSVTIEAKLKRAKFGSTDLALLNSSLEILKDPLYLSGDFSGKVGHIQGSNLDLQFGKQSRLRGSANFQGLPSISETFMYLNFKHSIIDPEDLIKYMDRNQYIRNIGLTQFDMNFLGFTSDFVAKGNFYSEAGKFKTDINFKINDNNLPDYSGGLSFRDFDLGMFLPQEKKLGKLTMTGTIKGAGLTKKEARFTLKANTDSIGYNGYTYRNILTRGYFEEELFKGNLSVKDSNLVCNGAFDIDLTQRTNKIGVEVTLDKVNLHKLGFSRKPISIQSSSITSNLKGVNLDDITGYLDLKDTKISFGKRIINLDSISLHALEVDSIRKIDIQSDGLKGQVTGRFKNQSLLMGMRNFAKELLMFSKPDSLQMEEYYQNKSSKELKSFKTKITVEIEDIDKYISPFFQNFHLSKGVSLQGSFIQDSTVSLDIFTEFDTLNIGDSKFHNNQIDINLSKETYGKEVLAAIYGYSNHQEVRKKYDYQNLIFEAAWYRDNMDVFFNLDQEKYANHLQINSQIQVKDSLVVFRFLPSQITLLDKDWNWNTGNQTAFSKGEISFSNVGLSYGGNIISVNGTYSSDTTKKVSISIDNLELHNLQSLIDKDAAGLVKGNISIKNLPEEHLIEGNINIDSLIVQDFYIGNISGTSEWKNDQKRLSVDFNLSRDSRNKISMYGFIYPSEISNQLDLEAQLKETELKIFEPIFSKNIENLSGHVNANLNISGRLNEPKINGIAYVKDGNVSIKYLKTSYNINGEVLFQENRIIPNQVELMDIEGNKGYLSGQMYHHGTNDPILDITMDFENLKLLNTSFTDNSSYYGTAYSTGNIHFGGSINNIIIDAKAKTAKGTRIAIPLNDRSDNNHEQEEFIEFVSLSDSSYLNGLSKFVQVEAEKIKGIQLLFNIEMTSDAYVELIFDIKAGDIIRGRGGGNIKLEINSNGDFNMFGDFEIEEGGYNFTLYNIINKEFDIQKGSTISWYGDPYEAQLDITAQYRQLTSIAPLLEPYLSEEEINSTEARRKYPAVVNLSLLGDLMSPLIKFGIDLENYPNNLTINNAPIDLESLLNAFKIQIANNEQEMNRQVFSLLILRKFSLENDFEVNSETLGNSLSEFVSNQLSYWATQVDENLEIDVDLSSLGNDALNTFQLRLSYTFFDGRLRISRGGGFSNNNSNSEQDSNDMSVIIGDWTVEYLLTKDGRLRAKMYSRSDQNEINLQTDENTMETGFSLQYIRSFDELKRIIGDHKEKNNSKTSRIPSTPNTKGVIPREELL